MTDISIEENKAIKTQLAMNNIPLNKDVMGVINEFLFQDKKAYVQEKIQKHKKQQLISVMKTNMGYQLDEYPEDNDGHWAVWVSFETDYDEFQLQSSNCMICGKYKLVSHDSLANAVMNNRYIMCVNDSH